MIRKSFMGTLGFTLARMNSIMSIVSGLAIIEFVTKLMIKISLYKFYSVSIERMFIRKDNLNIYKLIQNADCTKCIALLKYDNGSFKAT